MARLCLIASLLAFNVILQQNAAASTVTMYDLAGSWNVKTTTEVRISNVAHKTSSSTLTCTLTGLNTTDGAYTCTDPIGAQALSGSIHLVNDGRRLMWSVDSQTIANIENSGKNQLLIWADSKGKNLDSSSVTFDLKSINTTTMKIPQHVTASGGLVIGAPTKGTATVKGRVSASVDGKAKHQSFLFKTSIKFASRY